jgi:hypothetical protein
LARGSCWFWRNKSLRARPLVCRVTFFSSMLSRGLILMSRFLLVLSGAWPRMRIVLVILILLHLDLPTVRVSSLDRLDLVSFRSSSS